MNGPIRFHVMHDLASLCPERRRSGRGRFRAMRVLIALEEVEAADTVPPGEALGSRRER